MSDFEGNVLFFDTETTGLPLNYKDPSSEVDNWPRMVQLAFILCSSSGNVLESVNYIIKPDGYDIPDSVSDIHGVTMEVAENEGVDLRIVLEHFRKMLDNSCCLIAHNVEFDSKVVGCEFYRVFGEDFLIGKRMMCTMKNHNVIEYCALPPFRYGSYKWPTLTQLHVRLFSAEFEGAHDASADVLVLKKCFWELVGLGVL